MEEKSQRLTDIFWMFELEKMKLMLQKKCKSNPTIFLNHTTFYKQTVFVGRHEIYNSSVTLKFFIKRWIFESLRYIW